MNSISKNVIFYITILEKNRSEHSFLREVIHSVLPQAIVDSVYGDDEAIRYFNNYSSIPHLIFLDQEMLHLSGNNTVEHIKQVNGLEQVPIVFLTSAPGIPQNESLFQQHTDHFYSKPYEAQDLLNTVGSLNSKWIA